MSGGDFIVALQEPRAAECGNDRRGFDNGLIASAVTVLDEECLELAEASAVVSYGWGMIPVTARIGRTEWTTSLWPKDGRYVLPLKDVVRNAEGLEEGDTVTVRLTPGGLRRRG